MCVQLPRRKLCEASVRHGDTLVVASSFFLDA